MMKKLLLILLFLPMIGLAQINIPDTNFEQALIDLGYDDILNGVVDDLFYVDLIENADSLVLSGLAISDLTGLQHFINLSFLNISGNNLSSLENILPPLLYELDCSYNQLTELNLSNNQELTHLYCGGNIFATLDISENINLIHLWASNHYDGLTCVAVWDIDYAIEQENTYWGSMNPYWNIGNAYYSLNCDFPNEGCTDELACNFSQWAVNDDGSCIYQEIGYDCSGNCIEYEEPTEIINFDMYEVSQSNTCNIPIIELNMPPDWTINSFTVGEQNYNDSSDYIYGPFESSMGFVDFNLNISYDNCNLIGSYNQDLGFLIDPLNNLTTPICYTTVENNQNVIYWNNSTEHIVQYKIYRENAESEYELIGTVNSDTVLKFIDESSVATQQSYRYILTGIDECDFETTISANHETIHLASNLGVGGENNLSWNAYVGFAYETHQIFRSNNGGDFELINEVSSNNYSYTDITPPTGLNQYFISVSQTEECLDNIESLIFSNSTANMLLNSSSSNIIESITEDATSIMDFNKVNKKLRKITNLLGQETPIRKNSPMFYIYDDGTVEKKIIIE